MSSFVPGGMKRGLSRSKVKEIEIWENERFQLGSFAKKNLLPSDRHNWSDNSAKFNWISIEDVTLMPGWFWEAECSWVLDVTLGEGPEPTETTTTTTTTATTTSDGVQETTASNRTGGHWRYSTDFTNDESLYVDTMTPFCWIRRRRYTRRMFFPHKYVTREVEVYENERLQLGEYSNEGLLLTDRRNISSKDGKMNWSSFFAATNGIPIEGWRWEEDSEWVPDWTMGDEENWSYSTDFVERDDWYSHQSTPFSFVRRRRYKRRMVFSLAQYDDWRMEPAQRRHQSESTYYEQDENWALMKPTYSALFVDNPYFYMSASEATLGMRDSPASSIVEDASCSATRSVAVILSSPSNDQDNGSNWVLADAEQVHYQQCPDVGMTAQGEFSPSPPRMEEDMSSLRSIEL